MNLAGYREEVLTTSNTNLAATLLGFGLQLQKHNPTFVAQEYKHADLKRGFKDPKPPTRVFFNFIRNDLSNAIAAAFGSETADNDFEAYLAELGREGLEPGKVQKLRGLHSAALSAGARQIFEKREFLLTLVHKTPKEARWAVIRRSPTSFTIFPLTATPETLAKLIGQ
jgi:hypothetical protein